MFEEQTVVKELLSIVLRILEVSRVDEALSEDEEEWLDEFIELLHVSGLGN